MIGFEFNHMEKNADLIGRGGDLILIGQKSDFISPPSEARGAEVFKIPIRDNISSLA